MTARVAHPPPDPGSDPSAAAGKRTRHGPGAVQDPGSLLVLVNNRSGPDAHRTARRRALRAQLGRNGTYVETHSLIELDQAAAEIMARGYGTVALCGGDGTLGRTVTALHRHSQGRALPLIAPLRGGTMNTVARSVGVAGVPPAQRLRLLQRDPQRRIVPCATLAVQDRLGFLFSSGVMYGFLASYYRAGRGRPRATTAARVLLEAMASAAAGGARAAEMAQRFPAALTVDGVQLAARDDFLLVGAGTVQQAGLGFRPFRRARATPPRFHAIAYTGSLPGLLRALPLLAIGRGDLLRNARDLACQELILTHDRPLPYALDGDLFESAGPTTFRCGPEVRFLV